ncbi:MAG: hypothetical protein GKS00_09725 [Alphaproteobacteria bacterium]|nr:hypothetical protein [Alphaproteobacteria bacterium]
MLDFVDMRITELLCSRLCHELASPIGAINNGIEMIEEFDDSMLPDALPLIGSSAKLVAARLNFYRMAYGAAGNNSIASYSDMKQLADSYFEEGRTQLMWPGDPMVPDLGNGWGKLLLNMLPLAADTLPRGGSLSVAFEEATASLRMSVTAEGEGPRISEECGQALLPETSPEILTPRSVHAYFVSRLAKQLQSALEVAQEGTGPIEFSARLTR